VNPAPAQREAAGSATLPADPGATAAAAPELRADTIDYRVHRGDTLWSIARKHGTSVQELKEMNGLRSTRIAAGQVIQVPTSQQ
jgi:LysM repeat protein